MVLALAIPLRKAYGLEGLITDKHLDNSAKVMLATGLIVAYAYILETFTAWYSGNVYEQAAIWNRMTGPYAYSYWLLIYVQHRRAAGAVVQGSPQQPGAAVHLVDHGADRHVAGALRDYREQPGAGFPALVLGDLPRHALGLGAPMSAPSGCSCSCSSCLFVCCP